MSLTEDCKLQSMFLHSALAPQQTDEQREVVLHLSFPIKDWDETGRKYVLLLRACLQWDFKVFWLNAFI